MTIATAPNVVHAAALSMDADAFIAWMFARVPPSALLDWERRNVPRDAIDQAHRRAWQLILEGEDGPPTTKNPGSGVTEKAVIR